MPVWNDFQIETLLTNKGKFTYEQIGEFVGKSEKACSEKPAEWALQQIPRSGQKRKFLRYWMNAKSCIAEVGKRLK